MTITTNCANNRKAMARALAAHLGVQATYLYPPTYAFQVGELMVERDGAITGSPELLREIVPFLLESGYIDGVPEGWGDSEADEAEYTGSTSGKEDSTQENAQDDGEEALQETEMNDADEADSEDTTAVDAEADSEADATTNDEPIHRMCVSIPLAELTAPALTNILKLVYARQALIAAMTRSDLIYIHEELMNLLHDEKPDSVERVCELLEGEISADMVRGIDIQENRFTLSFPFDEAQSAHWTAYSNLLIAIVNRAKNAHHISGKRLDPQEHEMKYFCRNWLIQLGLGGPEWREVQHILLDHLHGYAAFRNPAQMEAHKARQAALRREQREENHDEEN